MRNVYQIVKQLFEVIERRRKRRDDMTVGTLGGMLFGDGIVGKEFSRMASKAEEERISDWKSTYGDEEPWNIRDILYVSRDPDEVKACMDLLLEKGFLMWDDPKLWDVFNRLQSDVIFMNPDDLKLSDYELKEKIKSACRVIWQGSADRFRQWEMSFDDNMKKAMGAHETMFRDMESQGGRDKVLSDMLQSWKRGKTVEVDPSKYEGFLKMAFEQGKMNGQPDQRWFFLIMGLTIKHPSTGQTILSRRVLDRFQDFMGTIPQIEFFTDKDSLKLHGEIVPEGTPRAEKRPWNFDDFEAWKKMLIGGGESNLSWSNESNQKNTTKFFYQVILMSDYSAGRAERTQLNAKGKLDHDDGAMFSALWDFGSVHQQMVIERSGVGKFTTDFWRRMLQGYDLYFRQTYDYINRKDKEWGNLPAWQEMKEKKLKQVGNRLKAAFSMTQALAGNYRKSGDAQEVFDKTKWEQETSQSASAVQSREKINDFMGKMLDDAGETQYKQLFDMHSNETMMGKPAFEAGPCKLNSELYNKDVLIFQNTERIERVLGDYVRKSGGSANVFTEAGADISQFRSQYRAANDEDWGEGRRAA